MQLPRPFHPKPKFLNETLLTVVCVRESVSTPGISKPVYIDNEKSNNYCRICTLINYRDIPACHY